MTNTFVKTKNNLQEDGYYLSILHRVLVAPHKKLECLMIMVIDSIKYHNPDNIPVQHGVSVSLARLL